jgi:hypothetical protein
MCRLHPNTQINVKIHNLGQVNEHYMGNPLQTEFTSHSKDKIVTSLKHVQQYKWLFSFTLVFAHRPPHVWCNEILAVGVRHALLKSYKVIFLPVILGVPSVVRQCFWRLTCVLSSFTAVNRVSAPVVIPDKFNKLINSLHTSSTVEYQAIINSHADDVTLVLLSRYRK